MKRVYDTNQTCWDHFREGNEDAFESLMRTQVSTLYNYGSKFTKDTDLVKDCVQELFLDLWQQRSQLPPVDSIRAYLMTALRNRLLRILQKQEQRMQSVALRDCDWFDAEFSIENRLIDEEIMAQRARQISQSLNQLSRRQKEIIYLRYYQDLDRAQIARMMNLSEQSVSNLLHRALKSLRNEWLVIGTAILGLVLSFL